jgi:hypothetical protein
MAQQRSVSPGHTVVFPNREEAASKAMKALVAVILLISVGLLLTVTIGGWSKLAGMKPLNFIWCVAYVVIAFYVFARWARGLLPIAAGLAILLLMVAVVAGLGWSGTGWFDRSRAGFAQAQTLFGGTGLDADTVGFMTLLLIPVQMLLVLFALGAFQQDWNVEQEVPIEEARRLGYNTPEPPSAEPA